MKKLKDLFIFLILEVGSVVWAAGVFSIIPNRRIAGIVASVYFLVFCIFMLFRILRWPRWWEAWSLYPLLIFLFGCTIPLLWERVTHLDRAFLDLRIWGIPGPEFHHVSTSVLGLLIVVTLAETVAYLLQSKRSR